MRDATQTAVAAGAIWYLTWLGVGIDCRRTGGSSIACWGQNPLTPQIASIERLGTIAVSLGTGAGLGGLLGFGKGYNTYNPMLRDPRQGLGAVGVDGGDKEGGQ